ncbi:hypothetical protein [Corynebacterium heidelbergense]|uniref:Uncharacterized protein n=1 Tax=Corynebacterium heidelbergense TaxID=2055947 RepID=A0A364V8W2_9CORY|nr:hypothetical protein [Corynebacterium heidelbergense]RAV33103.1 hypothetical protein DLJ54_00330 [Corynebacterium heidelbergense]
MHFDATLRVRELTQNIYDIGDEVAEHIEHVAQAMADWDPELLTECMHELSDVVAQGRAEVRPGLAELNGLRQAFISGIRAGEMSNHFAHPGRTLSFLHGGRSDVLSDATPTARSGAVGAAEPQGADGPAAQLGTQMASTAAWRLWLRTNAEALIARLNGIAEWVVQQTQAAVENQSVLLPQALYRAQTWTEETVVDWAELVAKQPELAADMRGEAPPAFLAERARVEAVVAKLQRRRSAAG